MTFEDLPAIQALFSDGQWLSGSAVWVFIGVIGMLVAGMLLLLYRSVASIAELRRLLSETVLEVGECRRALGLVESQSIDERLRALEERSAALTKGQEQLMLSDSSTASYLHAIRHAQRGADIDELMRTHGLARAEAELIVALHVSRSQKSDRELPGEFD
jgi:hypothetical protein